MAAVYFDLEESSPRLTPKAEIDDLSEIDFDDLKAEEIDEQENEEDVEQESDPFDGTNNISEVRTVKNDPARVRMAVSWTYDKVMHLIELFHSKTQLWDSTTSDYRYKTKRIEASREIAQALNIRRRDVEAKIHGLRTQFTKEKKKIAAKVKEGVPVDEVTKWIYYEPLKFLTHVTCRYKTGTDNKAVNKSASENDNIQNEYMTLVSPCDRVASDAASTSSGKRRKTEEPSRSSRESEELYSNRRHADETSRNRRESDDSDRHRRDSEERSRNRREVERSRKRERDDDELIDFDDRRSAKRKTEAMDACDIYGAYVASELRSVKDDTAVTQAKYHINNVLYQLKMGHYDKGKNPKSRIDIREN